MTHMADRKWFHGWQDELRPHRLFPGLTAGVLAGATEIIVALSLGSLVFSGELSSYQAYGIGLALVTGVVTMIGTALASSVPGVVGSVQDSSSVILAVIAAALAGTLSVSGEGDPLATVLVAIAVTTLLTGAFLGALGLFKLGGLVRFIPYPVVGGFLAGTGWLLVQGSFGVMADYSLTLSNIPALLQPGQLILWFPGVLLALALFFGLRQIDHFLAFPGLLLGVTILFYLALLLTGTSLEEAADLGLLLGEVTGEAVWQPLVPANLLAADWGAILGQAGNIITILILSAAGLLLNASAIELAARKDLDLNHELRVAGLTNTLSGLGGGMVGYHALTFSALSSRVGAWSRLTGLVGGAICLVILFAGSRLLAFLPNALLGGLLLFLGVDFLYEWVIEGWSKLPRADYAVVILILVVIATTDFLVGVGVGLVAMIVLFVVNYSRVDVVQHALTGREITSNVQRRPAQQRWLEKLGNQTYVIELRGFIFFGTANALLDRIRTRVAGAGQLREAGAGQLREAGAERLREAGAERLREAGAERLREAGAERLREDGAGQLRAEDPAVSFVVLDFRRATGLDSSAVLSFVKAKQLAEAEGFTLVLTQLSEEMRRQFEQGGLVESEGMVRIFADLDHGLEWCEEQLLAGKQVAVADAPATLPDQLVENGCDRICAERLMDYLERLEIEEGEYLIRQGEESDDLYFVERGTVSVYLELWDGRLLRLRTLVTGTAVGELGLYLGTSRTASVIADEPTTAYRLSAAALSEMTEQDPGLAASFHELVARLLSERLVATNRSLEAILK